MYKYGSFIKLLNIDSYVDNVPIKEPIDTNQGINTIVKYKEGVLQVGNLGNFLEPNPNTIEVNFVGRLKIPVIKINIETSPLGKSLTTLYDEIIRDYVRKENLYENYILSNNQSINNRLGYTGTT